MQSCAPPSSRRQSQNDFVYERGCTALDASMCAEGAHFDTRSVRSVFCDAHVAAENLLYFFFRCGEKTLRGFVYSLRRQCAELRTAVGNTWRNRSGLCSDETSPLDMKKNKKPATQMSYRFMVDDTRLELVTSRTSSGCATSCANRPALSSKKDYITPLRDCQAFSSRKPDFFRLRDKAFDDAKTSAVGGGLLRQFIFQALR